MFSLVRYSLSLIAFLLACTAIYGEEKGAHSVFSAAQNTVQLGSCLDTDFEARKELALRLGNIRSMTANFQQIVSSADGYLLQDMQGTLQLAKPDLMRWQTLPPFEQQLIADGEKLWLYDPDLEQVTVKSLKDGLGNSPAALLLSDKVVSPDNYEVCRLSPGPGREVSIALKPIDNKGAFLEIILNFKDNLPTTITMLDRLGQTTRLIFSEVQANNELNVGLFVFNPPDGVDIFLDQ